MIAHFPQNWFWQDAGGRIYSTAAQAVVSDSDTAFADWIAAGNQPIRWPSDETGEQTDAALATVLATHGLQMWPATLDQIKTTLKCEIDAAAEAERAKYLTAGTGQALTYQRKVEEAQRLRVAVAVDEEIDAAHFPMLSASIGVDGETLADVADVVLAMDSAWATIGAAIERERLLAKSAIDAAETETAARAVAPVWPVVEQ